MYKDDGQSANERKEKSGKFIIQKAFAYIKLYEQSTPPYEFIANPASFDNWFDNFGTIQNKNYIQDFQLVDQIKWDQAFKRNFNKDNEEQMSSKAYPNYAVSAGGALFANMITGGICNDTMVIYLEHLVIMVAHFRVIILVIMVRRTHVLEQAENVYC